ncbi:germination protein, Ger(x)C family [Kyrpidia tusciae DSM 2912]|uniref:Germination protein, Ger(X)C family n=1 Tax=Kyrpidia tusciae (strain DSM 2912 / NBRC 15312 / T2) TaxID=562970 RepID=D5WVF4_KYRT2|nr:germination protein, Ger(x)C family [Kyrpidia tusciae DSM 2912]
MMGIVGLCALMLPLLTGCWDRLELEQRAMILGIAVDEATPADLRHAGTTHKLSRPPRGGGATPVRLTAQIAVPGRIPLGPGDAGGGGSGGGGGGGGAAGQRPVWVLSASGYTMEDAVSNLQNQVAEPLFWGHLRILIMSEAVARRGPSPISDWLRRNAEIRRTLWLTVSRGEAGALMQATPPLERVPALYLWSTLARAQQLGRLPLGHANIFWRALSTTGQEPILPYLELRQQQNIFIRGLAYFRGNQMIGTLNPWEVGVFMTVKGLNPAGASAYVQVPGTGQFVMIRSTLRKSHLEVFWAQTRPGIRVRCHAEVAALEKTGGQINLSSVAQTRAVEASAARDLTREIQALIGRTQRERCDIFGFGELVRAQMYDYWQHNVRTKADWDRIYAEMPVEVEVTVNLRRTGTLNR